MPLTHTETVRPPSTQRLTEAQRAVLSHLRVFGPMTDEQLVETYEPRVGGCSERPRQAPSGLRTRRHELVEAGLVGWSGNMQRTSYGRLALEWRPL